MHHSIPCQPLNRHSHKPTTSCFGLTRRHFKGYRSHSTHQRDRYLSNPQVIKPIALRSHAQGPSYWHSFVSTVICSHGIFKFAAQGHHQGASFAHPLSWLVTFEFFATLFNVLVIAKSCADGGGVRGYSMLILLREFMHQTYERIHSKPEGSLDDDRPEDQASDDADPRPCDYFDLIAGTGTGGLIAIMLGRLRMSIVDCMGVYVQMTRRVFETDKTIAGIPYRSTLFKASKLEDAIRDCVRENEKKGQRENIDDNVETPSSPGRPGTMYSTTSAVPKRSMSCSSAQPWEGSLSWSHDAYLYDTRPNRTKT